MSGSRCLFGIVFLLFLSSPGILAKEIDFRETALQEIAREDFSNLFRGASFSAESPEGIMPLRVSETTLAYHESKDNKWWWFRARCSAGIVVAFESDTAVVELDGVFEKGALDRGQLVLFVDDIEVGPLSSSGALPGFKSRVAIPGTGFRRIEIQLPGGCGFRLSRLAIEKNSTLRMAARRPVLLALGDSITQGRYPGIAARILKMDLHNAGISGHQFEPDSLTEPYLAEPAIITIAYGTNDWSSGASLDLARVYLQKVRAFWPETRVIVLSPIFRIEAEGAELSEARVNRDGITLAEYREGLKRVVEEFDAIEWIDSEYLLPAEEDLLLADGVHPTAHGHTLYGQNLARWIQRTSSSVSQDR